MFVTISLKWRFSLRMRPDASRAFFMSVASFMMSLSMMYDDFSRNRFTMCMHTSYSSRSFFLGSFIYLIYCSPYGNRTHIPNLGNLDAIRCTKEPCVIEVSLLWVLLPETCEWLPPRKAFCFFLSCTPRGIRTHTGQCLKLLPLPIGLEGHFVTPIGFKPMT